MWWGGDECGGAVVTNYGCWMELVFFLSCKINNHIWSHGEAYTIYIYFFQTYTGNILIAVNPFTKLPHLYDSHMMAQYKGAAFGELSPHPFAVADAAYR